MRFTLLFLTILIAEAIANGSYKYPPGCSSSSCVYTATWRRFGDTQRVVFTISANVPRGQWAGIGFSKDKNLANTDAYIGYYLKTGDQFMFSDRYIYGKITGLVLIDRKKNGVVLDKKYSNNRMAFSFIRELDTQDPSDIALNGCVYFQYAWGGEGNADMTITPHTMAMMSQSEICDLTSSQPTLPTVPPYQPTMYQDMQSESVVTGSYDPVPNNPPYQGQDSARYYRSEETAYYQPPTTAYYQPPATTYNPPATVYYQPPTPVYKPDPMPPSSPVVVYRPPEDDLGYETGSSFRYPRGCTTGVSCIYEVEWESDPFSNFVWFRINAQVGPGIWAGIGFSNNKRMLYSDAATGFMSSGNNFVLQDRYLSGYDANKVVIDEIQNLELVSHSQSNGRLSFMFKKPRGTGDKKDRSLSKCNYLLFAWGGRGSGSFISKHTHRFVSQEKVCLGDKHGYTGPIEAPKYEFVNRRVESHEEQCQKLNCQRNEVCEKSGTLSFCECKPGYSRTAIGCRPVIATVISGPPIYTLDQEYPSARSLERGYGTETSSSFRYPGNCIIGTDCEFVAQWESYPLSDYLWFTITARVGVGYWAGIGFSSDKLMIGSDAITGHMSYDNQFMLYDRFLYSKSPQGATVDANQNAVLVTSSHKEGLLTFLFKRMRDTGDYGDDHALSNCKYLLFAWGGRADGTTLNKHTHRFVTDQQRCLGPKHGYTGPGSSFAEVPRYEYLRRPLEDHYDPCRRIECKKDSLCIREGEKAICRCPVGYEDTPQGCYMF